MQLTVWFIIWCILCYYLMSVIMLVVVTIVEIIVMIIIVAVWNSQISGIMWTHCRENITLVSIFGGFNCWFLAADVNSLFEFRIADLPGCQFGKVAWHRWIWQRFSLWMLSEYNLHCIMVATTRLVLCWSLLLLPWPSVSPSRYLPYKSAWVPFILTSHTTHVHEAYKCYSMTSVVSIGG